MAAHAEAITVASTTSTEQSGLFGYLLPAFKKATGIDVKVVAVGTGQALDMGRRGDADVVFVHDQVAEEKFLAEGFGVKRLPVMYNDFVLIGPTAIRRACAATTSWPRCARSQPPMRPSSRAATRAAPTPPSGATGRWPAASPRARGYRECGCGMGPALNIAASAGAYVLADRGTWLSFKNREGLAILVEGDKRLFNQYGVMMVNPAKHPQVKVAPSQKFIDWLVSREGQASHRGLPDRRRAAVLPERGS